MLDEKDKAERPDDFSDYMRRRLDEHRLPVDADCWEGLEARMNRKPWSEGWWWACYAVAAAILILVVCVMPMPEDMPMDEPALSSKKEKMAETRKEELPPSGQINIPEEKVSPVRGMMARTIVPERVVLADIPDVAMDEEPEISLVAIPVGGAIKKTSSTVPVPEGYLKNRVGEPGKEKVIKKDRRRKNWQLSATVGSSGYVEPSMGMDSDNPMDDKPSQDPGPGEKPDDDKDGENGNGNGNPVNVSRSNLRSSSLRNSTVELPELDRSFESYPYVSYAMPISFGFTVRKNLNKHIGVESGLVYTYLSSRFRQFGQCRTEVKSRLHYLGIPVNLVVNLWDHPRWNLYLSGGVMMEKGIQAVYSERKIWSDRIDNRSAKEGIDGLQWSVNASVGAAYRVYRDWSLYVEPRFSYYFNSDQPASIRTDKPMGLGLNGGVRFEF